MEENTQQHIAKHLGELLASSPLAEEIKKTILDNLEKLPGYMVFDLINALENEEAELGRISLDIELFLKKQGQDWQKLEEEQKEAADQIIGKEVQNVENEIKHKETE